MGDNAPFLERLGCTCFQSRRCDQDILKDCKGLGHLAMSARSGLGKSQGTTPTKAVERFSLSVGLETKYIVHRH